MSGVSFSPNPLPFPLSLERFSQVQAKQAQLAVYNGGHFRPCFCQLASAPAASLSGTDLRPSGPTVMIEGSGNLQV
jgi:hypothetical protein